MMKRRKDLSLYAQGDPLLNAKERESRGIGVTFMECPVWIGHLINII